MIEVKFEDVVFNVHKLDNWSFEFVNTETDASFVVTPRDFEERAHILSVLRCEE